MDDSGEGVSGQVSKKSPKSLEKVSRGWVQKSVASLEKGPKSLQKPNCQRAPNPPKFAQPRLSRVKARPSPARGYKSGCVCSYMAGHEDIGVVTGHIGTNTPKFVPPRRGRPRVDPTQTGLCKFGWVWSSLKLQTFLGLFGAFLRHLFGLLGPGPADFWLLAPRLPLPGPRNLKFRLNCAPLNGQRDPKHCHRIFQDFLNRH